MRVSKMTSQKTRSWNVAPRQLAEGGFGVCERYVFFYDVARRELLQKKLILKYVGNII